MIPFTFTRFIFHEARSTRNFQTLWRPTRRITMTTRRISVAFNGFTEHITVRFGGARESLTLDARSRRIGRNLSTVFNLGIIVAGTYLNDSIYQGCQTINFRQVPLQTTRHNLGSRLTSRVQHPTGAVTSRRDGTIVGWRRRLNRINFRHVTSWTAHLVRGVFGIVQHRNRLTGPNRSLTLAR